MRAVDEIHAQSRGLTARCLLETTAGQGTSLGWRFEQMAAILDGLKEPDRMGFCFDTCHVSAAGYRLSPERAYQATMAEFDRLLGLDRIKAFHLNDSRRALGSRIDRHEHIGRGELGLEPFRLLLADPRFRDVPMYLETPKDKETGRIATPSICGCCVGWRQSRRVVACNHAQASAPITTLTARLWCGRPGGAMQAGRPHHNAAIRP